MNRHGHMLSAALLALLFFSGAAWASGYKTVSPAELKAMLAHKDFFLLDVHIPEQRHIPGTDAFIDFRRIKQNADKLPVDKATKIVVYCLGGGMSRLAANSLMELGYARVYNLQGGTWAFRRLPAQ